MWFILIIFSRIISLYIYNWRWLKLFTIKYTIPKWSCKTKLVKFELIWILTTLSNSLYS
jgi:hypothetical protein